MSVPEGIFCKAQEGCTNCDVNKQNVSKVIRGQTAKTGPGIVGAGSATLSTGSFH